MGETTKNNTTTGLVSSGTGNSVNAKAISAGDFAYGRLGSGTAGGQGNAALLSTTTILPNTRRTNIAKSQLEAADRAYTQEMNLLSQFWTAGDTSSASYDAQKQASLSSQYKWELARNKLEEVAESELTSRLTPSVIDADLPITNPGIDLIAIDDLSTEAGESDEQDIVVTAQPHKDRRIRIKPKLANRDEIFGTDASSVLFLLHETDGVFFPYTPTIDMSHRAEYSSVSPTHANTSYYSYVNSPAVEITITGEFTAQNLEEARYTLAAMHFFRSVTKMHFGEEDQKKGTAGLPPPVLELSGYGDFMFNDLNVIVRDFKMDLPNNVNYLEVNYVNSVAWVPALTTFTVSCVVQQTPKKQRSSFNFEDFAHGKLLEGGVAGKGWI